MVDFRDPIQGFKDDPIGTLLRGVDNGQRLPSTRTRTSYSLTIHARVGNRSGVIGAVHEISPRQNLQVEEIWEVNQLARGLPRELVPQILSGRTLGLARYDLYTATMEEVFGSPELVTLCDQTGPLSLRLMWKPPSTAQTAIILPEIQPRLKVTEFVDCYMTELGRTVSMDNIVVGANATIVWRNIRQLQ